MAGIDIRDRVSGRNFAGVGRRVGGAHDGVPLGLRHLVLPHLESFGDPNAMDRTFHARAAVRSHREFSGRYFYERAAIEEGAESIRALLRQENLKREGRAGDNYRTGYDDSRSEPRPKSAPHRKRRETRAEQDK